MSWGRGWEMRTSSGKMTFQKSLVTNITSYDVNEPSTHSEQAAPFSLAPYSFPQAAGQSKQASPKATWKSAEAAEKLAEKSRGVLFQSKESSLEDGYKQYKCLFYRCTNAVLVRWVSSAAQGSVWCSWNLCSCTKDQGTTLSPSKDPETEAKFITKSFTINLLKRRFWKTQFLSILNFITSRKKVHW